jgi:hypothetical protein
LPRAIGARHFLHCYAARHCRAAWIARKGSTMDLESFRATRKLVTRQEAESLCPYIGDADYGAEYTHVALYDGGFYILKSRSGYYLGIEGDEYLTRDLALLEFVLWLWIEDRVESNKIRGMIWG